MPRTAAVSGIITVSAAVPAFGTAPVAALVPRTASRTASLPRLPVLSVGMHLTRGPRPAFTPHDLIVIFRHTVLGAPPVEDDNQVVRRKRRTRSSREVHSRSEEHTS